MSATTGAPFDPAGYKATTREQWQQAAEPWHRWGPTLEAWLGEATETMLDLAGVGAGTRVLDVAAGAGGQTLAAARRVGDDGAVLATDLAPDILDFAEREARAAGLANVAVRAMDAEGLDLEPGTFDAAICRLGLMYLPVAARRAGGRAPRAASPAGGWRAIVFSTPERNGFFSVRWASSAAAPDSARRSPVSRAPSASAPPACWPARSPPRASAPWRCERSTRRCGCRRPPTACAWSRRASVRCTRCSPASTTPAAPRRGRGRHGPGGLRRARRASRDRASCWSVGATA